MPVRQAAMGMTEKSTTGSAPDRVQMAKTRGYRVGRTTPMVLEKKDITPATRQTAKGTAAGLKFSPM